MLLEEHRPPAARRSRLRLQELGRQPWLDPLLSLPLLPKSGIPGAPDQILEHRTCFAQEWIAEGEADVALYQLNRRCSPLSHAATACIQGFALV